MLALVRRLLGGWRIRLTWLDREPRWADAWDVDTPEPKVLEVDIWDAWLRRVLKDAE